MLNEEEILQLWGNPKKKWIKLNKGYINWKKVGKGTNRLTALNDNRRVRSLGLSDRKNPLGI